MNELGYTEKQIAELKAAAEACYFDLLRAEYEMEIIKLEQQLKHDVDD